MWCSAVLFCSVLRWGWILPPCVGLPGTAVPAALHYALDVRALAGFTVSSSFEAILRELMLTAYHVNSDEESSGTGWLVPLLDTKQRLPGANRTCSNTEEYPREVSWEAYQA